MGNRLCFVALVVLSGCATTDPSWDYEGFFQLKSLRVQSVNEPELHKICRATTVNACFAPEGVGKGVIYMGPRADNCSLRHELRHAAGWKHRGPLGDCG